MICKAMLTYPLTYDDYLYEGLGNYLAIGIVCVPLSFMPMYMIYRINVTEGATYQEVRFGDLNIGFSLFCFYKSVCFVEISEGSATSG